MSGSDSVKKDLEERKRENIRIFIKWYRREHKIHTLCVEKEKKCTSQLCIGKRKHKISKKWEKSTNRQNFVITRSSKNKLNTPPSPVTTLK